MSAISLVDHRQLVALESHPSGTCVIDRPVQATPSMADDRLWLMRLVAEDGTRITWEVAHDDEVILVVSGVIILADGVPCGQGDAVVIEAGASTSLRACGQTELLHYGSRGERRCGPLGPPRTDGHGAYVIACGDRQRIGSVRDGALATITYWADSTRATTRLALFEIACSSGFKGRSHSHSQDELIFVTAGELRVGALRVEAGMSICVPADLRYRFIAPGAHRFLNFRPDASEITVAPRGPAQLETLAAILESSPHERM